MTFCKEMSSRVEEPFCKNICFLGIDTKYCSDLYMFLIRLNHLIAAYKNGCLKINESGKTRNREPEVVSLQNDARKRYLKSQLLIKRSSSRIQHDTTFIS